MEIDSDMKKVAIIGAGISGLATAHQLKDNMEIVLFEKEQSPGGLIRCKRIGGCLYHLCGGHVFNSKRQDVLDWFWNKFNRDEEFTKADRNSIVFMSDGRQIPYPIENHIYQFDSETQKSFIEDLLQIAKDKSFIPQNFEKFLKYRFGKTLYELYFKPYNEKIWRRDLKNVPLTWLEGKLPMPTVQEIIFNNINQIKEKSFVHATFWYSKLNGSQYIADTLAKDLNIRYNSEITALHRIGNKWKINGEIFDYVIMCGNVKQLPELINGMDLSSFTADINALEYHGTTSVFCEIDATPYSWIYLPDNQYDSHRIICTGNFAASNNMPNKMTATIEFTDYISESEIMEQLKRIPLHPQYISHHYSQYTYPIQSKNTRDMITALKAYLAKENFFLTGRFADWEYYNMDAAIGAAIDLCKQITTVH